MVFIDGIYCVGDSLDGLCSHGSSAIYALTVVLHGFFPCASKSRQLVCVIGGGLDR